MKRGATDTRRFGVPVARPPAPVGQVSVAKRRALSPPPPPPSKRREVNETDLERLDALGALLLTLNDPRASAVSVARHVRSLDVLAARIEQRFVLLQAGPPPGLTEQIALLGNRELEAILLGLLEDVVTLHSTLRDGCPSGGT
jgi:hypothetical protein